jgi:hypothetical protein
MSAAQNAAWRAYSGRPIPWGILLPNALRDWLTCGMPESGTGIVPQPAFSAKHIGKTCQNPKPWRHLHPRAGLGIRRAAPSPCHSLERGLDGEAPW